MKANPRNARKFTGIREMNEFPDIFLTKCKKGVGSQIESRKNTVDYTKCNDIKPGRVLLSDIL